MRTYMRNARKHVSRSNLFVPNLPSDILWIQPLPPPFAPAELIHPISSWPKYLPQPPLDYNSVSI